MTEDSHEVNSQLSFFMQISICRLDQLHFFFSNIVFITQFQGKEADLSKGGREEFGRSS